MWSHDFFEKILRHRGYRAIAGVDEVGRGALAGPVVAAAIVLDGKGDYAEIRDSKVLSVKVRERLSARLKKEALGFGLASVSETVVDKINILKATHQAMRDALSNLPVRPEIVLVDGFWLPGLDVECIGIIGGDARSYSIAAASIVAKVHRDDYMSSIATDYPQYGIDRNKGYGTRFHLEAIRRYGPCPCHRLTFAGVTGPKPEGMNDGD
jgi:ribonuclease HII